MLGKVSQARMALVFSKRNGGIAGTLSRALNTFAVRRPATSAGDGRASTNDRQLVRVTGFTGGYLPSKEDFMMIIKRALRPEIRGGDLVAPEVPSKFEDVFTSFATYPNRSGGGTVVFQLKSDALYAQLPFARPLDPSARPKTLNDRTAWCGVLLPVLDNKIMPLNGFVLHRLQQRKQYPRMKWYSLLFSDYKPDLLIIDGVKDDVVRDALKKHNPELIVSMDVKPGRVRSSPGETKVVLKFSSMRDLVLVRACLDAEGIQAVPLESERFNLRKAFLSSEYRGVDNSVERPVYREERVKVARAGEVPEVMVTKIQPPTEEEMMVTKIQSPVEAEILATKVQPPPLAEVPVTKIQPPLDGEPVLVSKIQPPADFEEHEETGAAGGRRRGANRRSSASLPNLEESFFEHAQATGAVDDSDDFYAIEERVSPFRYEYLTSKGPRDGGQQQASM